MPEQTSDQPLHLLALEDALKLAGISPSDTLEERLKKAGISHFDELIHEQPKDWLAKNFPPDGRTAVRGESEFARPFACGDFRRGFRAA